jgi:hypothetical protein
VTKTPAAISAIPAARTGDRGETRAPKSPKWSISGGGDHLAEEHEEDCVADPEARRDPRDREHVERDEEPREEEVLRLGGKRLERPAARDRDDEPRRSERHEEEAEGRHGRAPDPLAERCVERGEDGDADACREHDEGVAESLGDHGALASRARRVPGRD